MGLPLDWDSEIGGKTKVNRAREKRNATAEAIKKLQETGVSGNWSQCPLITCLENEGELSVYGDAIALVSEDLKAIEAQERQSDQPPKILTAFELVQKPIIIPAEIIPGLLYQCSKMMYGGPSKAHKSWALLDLSVAVAIGGEWFGFKCSEGAVLYINYELQAFAVKYRIERICEARGCPVPENLYIWNMRGKRGRLKDLIGQVQDLGLSLIIPDPIYKAYTGIDENGTKDVSEACYEIESMCERTGAAVAFGAHFAKGNASSKQALDRVSGSGVWARDPDAILMATPHQREGAFCVDAILRNFPPVPSFVIEWQMPQMIRRKDLDPKDLLEPGKGAGRGRNAAHTIHELLDYLDEPMTASDWFKAVSKDSGVSKSTFFRLLKENPGLVKFEKKGREKRYQKRVQEVAV